MSALGSIFSGMFKDKADDVASTLAHNYSDDVLNKLARSSADDIAAQQGNLIATHQLFPDKLKGAAELGGFVQPSMAVIDPNKGSNFMPGSGFGDIVMVANRDTINPAKKAMKNVIGDRDIYSPRFPQVSYEPNMDAIKQLADNTMQSKQYIMSNIGLDDEPLYSNVVRDMYVKQHPDIANMGARDLRENTDFMKFGDDLFNDLRGEKVLKYYTPSGAPKSMELTAENANKIMNKSGAVGSEQGWQTPRTRAYHQNTKYLRSLDDLYKNRNRLIDNQTGDVTKDIMSDEISRLADQVDQLNIPMFADNNPYTRTDSIADHIVDAFSGRGSLAPEIPADIAAEIDKLGQAYKNVPVTYFEAKPRRVVGGNEFYGAYVPQDAEQSVIDNLNALGVTNINRYSDPANLDEQLLQLAQRGKRGVSPYVLGLGAALPTAGALSGLFNSSGGDNA